MEFSPCLVINLLKLGMHSKTTSHMMKHKECDAKSQTRYWRRALAGAARQLVLAGLKVALVIRRIISKASRLSLHPVDAP